MKKIFLMILMTIQSLLSAKSDLIKSDPVWQEILKQLPKSWTASYNKNRIELKSTQKIYILFENQINVPFSKKSQAEINNDIMKRGQKTYPRIILKSEPVWTLEKYSQCEKHNNEISEKISKLPQKYEISALYDKRLSRKGEETYIAKNQDDEKRIQLYYQEKAKLQSQYLKKPDANTRDFSLFIEKIEGIGDDMHKVYPQELSQEVWKVKELIMNLNQEIKSK